MTTNGNIEVFAMIAHPIAPNWPRAEGFDDRDAAGARGGVPGVQKRSPKQPRRSDTRS